jgi:hypothetical protein
VPLLQENPTGFEAFDRFETIQEENSGPATVPAAAAEAPAAATDTADLMAAADAALAEAAAYSVAKSPGISRRSSLDSEFGISCQRRHSSLDTGASASAFAAALPASLRSGSEDSLGLQALQGLQVMPSKRHSMLLSVRSMRSTGLPRASTLKLMESSRAWEELQGMCAGLAPKASKQNKCSCCRL